MESAKALQGHARSYYCARRRPDSGGVPDRVECGADQGWPVSSTWDYGPRTRGVVRGRADHGRSRCRRDIGCQLGRFSGTGTHAVADHQEARGRDHPDREASGRAATTARSGARPDRQHSGGIRPHHQGRCHHVDCSGEGGKDPIRPVDVADRKSSRTRQYRGATPVDSSHASSRSHQGLLSMQNLKKIRTDVVGSLQRPPLLKDARAKFEEGKLSAAEFRTIEDEAVDEAVRMQEAIGLDVLTDGELRRLNFQDSFGMAVEGYDADASKSTLKSYEKRVEAAAPNQLWDMPELQHAGTGVSTRRPTKARLRLTRNIPLEEYEYVSKIAKTPAKVSLIGPDRISQRFDHQNSKGVYDSMDEFVDDVVRIERAIVE